MEKDYNWTQDGEIIQNVLNNTWETFAQRHELNFEYSSTEQGKLKSMSLTKNDLLMKIVMSRTSSFDCYYYSHSNNCKFSFMLNLFKFFIPKGQNFVSLCESNGLVVPSTKMPKEERWTIWMNNYIFLLEEYCSELLKTGDICGWLENNKPS